MWAGSLPKPQQAVCTVEHDNLKGPSLPRGQDPITHGTRHVSSKPEWEGHTSKALEYAVAAGERSGTVVLCPKNPS